MGFWGSLLKDAVGFIPGVGPALSMGLDMAGSVGKGMEAGREKSNVAAQDASTFQLREAQGAEGAVQNRAQIEVQQKRLADELLRNQAKSALQAAFAKNVQDVGVSGQRPGTNVINFSGGARPSAMGQEGRDAASVLYDKSLEGMKNGPGFSPLTPIERVQPAAYKTPGFFENLLGTAGTIGKGITGLQDRHAADDTQGLIAKLLEGLQAPGQAGVSGTTPGPTGIGAKTFGSLRF